MSMNKMIKQAQQLQAKMEQIQKELEAETVEATSGGGAVKVVVTGQQVVRSVTIEPEAAEDVEMLQDLVLTAVNEAIKKSQELAQNRLGELTAGIKIPGLM
jgi:DNA-binding YbaB/EbfC family protein